MSLSLGEKLRLAREERGFTLSEVAEQTRISSLYLQSIENDDYAILPGGIFNKGFVKSYAKFVGINEQEALADYSQLLSDTQAGEEEEPKHYKPEVWSDDRTGSSMIPTVIVAVVILALMTAGILYLVNYLRRPVEPLTANTATRSNANSETAAPSETSPSNLPDMGTLKVELKAAAKLSVIVTVDSEPAKKTDIAAGDSNTFSPKNTLTLSYLRWNAASIQLAINGKNITLPAAPLDPKDKDRIVFTISKDNLAQIWTSGSISPSSSARVPDTNAVTPSAPAAPAQARPTPKPPVAANTAMNTTKPPAANTAKPTATGKPPAPTAKPTPKP